MDRKNASIAPTLYQTPLSQPPEDRGFSKVSPRARIIPGKTRGCAAIASTHTLRPCPWPFHATHAISASRIERGASVVLSVSAAEFQRNIGRCQDLAQRAPVAVTRNGRQSCVLISTEEYRRLKRRDREGLGLDGFTDADIAALEASRPPAESAAFNSEAEP